MGYEVDIMVRSILLRGFDQEIAEKIGENMQKQGVNFIRPTIPNRVEKLENNKLRVYYNDPYSETLNNEIYKDYDTVLVATGRYADLSSLGLNNVNAKLSVNKKLETDVDCKIIGTENVYALGDVVEGKLELTPTAILDGKLLAGRLLNIHNEHMTWDNIPTTVFTPLEYGCIGLSEEQATEKYDGQ